MNIELFSKWIFMKVESDIFIRIDLFRIVNYSFNCQSLDCIDIFYIFNKILILNLLRVAASGVFSAKQVS